jgi:hypothetical protein
MCWSPDRGEVVAEIGPFGDGAADASVASPLVTLAAPSWGDARLYPPLPRKSSAPSAAELLNDERGGGDALYAQSGAVLAWLMDEPAGRSTRILRR